MNLPLKKWTSLLWALLLLPLASVANDAIVHPVLMLDHNTQTQHDGHVQISFSAMGKDITLNLVPTTLLNLADSTPYNATTLPVLLQGTVIGDPSSWARITINDGKPTGYIWLDDHLYQLTLSEHPAEQNNSLNRSTERALQWVMLEADASAQLRINGRVNLPRAVTRAIRIGVVIDTQFDLWHQGRGLAKALEIINGVDGLYQDQLGVAVIVESIVELSSLDTDPLLAIDGKLEDVLLGFRDYRSTQPSLTTPLTLVHLFSGHRDPSGVVGLGWIDTACRTDGYDLSVSTPFAFDVLLAAHEIAHNLGAVHDDDARCAGSVAEQSNTLMISTLSSETTSILSPCSLNNIRPAISRNCNLDNIDLSLNVSSAPASNDGYQRNITLTINNTDAQRTAQQAKTRTTFPTGSSLSGVPSSCTLDQGALLCNHYDIGALASDNLSFVVSLPNLPTLRIISIIELDTISDINKLNNRKSIDALVDTNEEIAQADGSPSGSGAGGGGLGRTDFLLLLTLLFSSLISLHRYNKSRLRPA